MCKDQANLQQKQRTAELLRRNETPDQFCLSQPTPSCFRKRDEPDNDSFGARFSLRSLFREWQCIQPMKALVRHTHNMSLRIDGIKFDVVVVASLAFIFQIFDVRTLFPGIKRGIGEVSLVVIFLIWRSLVRKRRSAKLSIAEYIDDEESKRSERDGFRWENKEFLDYLSNFFTCREEMECLYKELDPNEALKNHNIKSTTKQYQQESIAGTPIKRMDDLYKAARIAELEFKTLIRQIVHEANPTGGVVEAIFAPLKGIVRAQEKAEDKYSEREPGPPCSWLSDIVRGSILCSNVESLLMILELIQKNPSIHIVKAKNRFQKPTPSGYRDFNLALQITTEKNFKHICEVQIHLVDLKELGENQNSHFYYGYFRTFFSGSTTSLKERLNDLELISMGKNFKPKCVLKINDVERLKRFALLFKDQLSELSWALRVYKRILEVQLTKYGSEHPDVANTYNSMAIILQKKGKDKGALELYKRALAIRKKNFGDQHASVAYSYNNMAVVQQHQKKFVEALKMYLEALKIARRKDLAECQSLVAAMYNNMGIIRHSQGKLEEALKLHQKSMWVKKRIYGTGHPSIAASYNNIGAVLEDQHKLDDARKMYVQSVEIIKKARGEDHYSVAKTYNNMARVLDQQGKLEDASDYRWRAFRIENRKRLGVSFRNVAVLNVPQTTTRTSATTLENIHEG